VPSSFHFVYPGSPAHSDAILALSQSQPGIVFVSTNKPPGLPPDRWAAYRSYRSNPQPTAADINALLVDPATAPRFVMLEELHNRASGEYFVRVSNEMRTRYPQWAGRWGAFVGYANYPVLADGLDALLRADAVLSLELYPRQSQYCASAQTAGERDIWLAEQFAGNARIGRIRWLMKRREMHGSRSFVTPLFGVGDVLLDGRKPAVFLDRIFYVWKTRSGFPSMIAAANGGPGAYKWQNVEETALKYGVGNTSRDLAFAQSYQHYSVQGATNSRLGQVPCP
jgi:hypothetical protein